LCSLITFDSSNIHKTFNQLHLIHAEALVLATIIKKNKFLVLSKYLKNEI